MRIGFGPLALSDLTATDLRQMARKAESAGCDSVWVSEARGRGAGGGLAAAAYLAELVAIRVGVVVQAGLYHPLHLAEDIAVADVSSQGRIEVAITQGDQTGARRYGVARSAARVAEEIGIVTTALSGAHFRHEGRYYRIPANLPANGATPSRLAINPTPAQPSVPIWLDAGMPRSESLSRRLGLGVLLAWDERGGRPRRSIPGLPPIILCPPTAGVDELVAAAEGGPRYFLVGASTPAEADAMDRRLVAALRMPDPPAWVTAG
jgi:alkanesulfonate monooxygenase SsuD/methylene tetrahydromethanopterin reductase-like flavin-dependent oxidoreductase (luciferase family)